jgi:hypothetical protein
MKRSPATLAGMALLFFLAAPGDGRADPVAWTYSWSASPSSVFADSPGTGYISVSNLTTSSVAGNSDVVAANLQVHSTATAAQPDVFTNAPYTLTLTLTDVPNNRAATVSFTGQLNGTATALSAEVTSAFTGSTTQSVQLGDNQYQVSISSFTPPGPPGAVSAGSIGARAVVLVDTLPEPGALTLSALGAWCVGLAGWRRRRR